MWRRAIALADGMALVADQSFETRAADRPAPTVRVGASIKVGRQKERFWCHVQRVSEVEYQLHIRPDPESPRHRLWCVVLGGGGGRAAGDRTPEK